MSSRVLAHHAEVVAVSVGNVVVPARETEDRADVRGPGEDAGLLAERESVVDVVLTTCGIQGCDQFLAEHGGLERL
ncbi:hypothetical protein ACIQNG_33820 [Streptomyces sp. NPDC091377]|uniref:hypothetical protein n=1 Tax=Streptomyces sp. NPDC091377 TaxID=3365995 RepID=UPI003802A581